MAILLAVLTLAFTTHWLLRGQRTATSTFANGQHSGVISLSPAVTDTIVRLGGDEQLVGVSDYCEVTRDLPRVGTALSPNYETIAELKPSLLVGTNMSQDAVQKLRALAPTHTLPWLTLPEVTSSIVELGKLIEKEEKAQHLARQFEEVLSTTPPERGPRILLVMNYGDSGSQEVWFVRKNSLHGALLHAAGARNAVDREVTGLPKLSVEELLRVNPDGIIVLRGENADPTATARIQKRLSKLEPLTAVQKERIEIVSDEDILHMGPTVLQHVEVLRDIVNEWSSEIGQ